MEREWYIRPPSSGETSSPQLPWMKLQTLLCGQGPRAGARLAGVMPALGMHSSVGALTSVTQA